MFLRRLTKKQPFLCLAYPIKRQTEALLACFSLKANPAAIKDIKTSIEKTPEIIRFLIIKKQADRPAEPAQKAAKAKKEPPSEKPTDGLKENTDAEAKKAKGKEKVALSTIEKELDQIL